jgi:hypothetical protein
MAFEEFDKAEAVFRSLGDGDLIGMAKVNLYRGLLHLRLRDVREALSQATQCAAAAAAVRFQPLRSACLLFKSQLLLEQEVPQSEHLYEEILGNLGALHTPEMLFKVVSNLYLYSWELDDQLDLTDYHMRQISKMAEILDRQTFDRLYTTLVVRRVAQRWMARALGVDPPAPEPPED